MPKLPDYIGPVAFGLKMGVILPGMSIVDTIFEQLCRCHRDGLLQNGDIVCITESVVARAQNNYVTTSDIAREVQLKLGLTAQGKVAVVFPIASRNRFSLVLKGIAEAVPRGKVLVQFSYPCDEVGNQIISPDFAKELGRDLFTLEDLGGRSFKHPITGVDYVGLYREIIQSAGAEATIYFCNDPAAVARFEPDGVIAADVHNRAETKRIIRRFINNCIGLDDMFTEGQVRSEWGLLGSNMSAGNKLKLAPREGKEVVCALQRKVAEQLHVRVEVLIYGDGAYRDPSSGIYELADPQPAFAVTGGLKGFREGIKLKYLADRYYHEGKSAAEIEQILEQRKAGVLPGDSMEKEGTTPRRIEDILASLADLVSGSADAGTPVVIIKGF